MRTRVPLIVSAAFLLCMHSACRRSADVRNLALVDSLNRVNDSLIAALNGLDLIAVDRIDSLYRLKAPRIDTRMRDTLKKDEALALGNYHRTMRKYAGYAKKGMPGILTRLEQGRQQLMDLRNDVDKGLLEPAQETRYISDERIALALVQNDAGKVAASVATVLRDEAAYGAIVDSLLAKDTLQAP